MSAIRNQYWNFEYFKKVIEKTTYIQTDRHTDTFVKNIFSDSGDFKT